MLIRQEKPLVQYLAGMIYPWESGHERAMCVKAFKALEILLPFKVRFHLILPACRFDYDGCEGGIFHHETL